MRRHASSLGHASPRSGRALGLSAAPAPFAAFGRIARAILLASVSFPSPALPAQDPPSLDSVLARLRANVRLYYQTLPDLFAEERFLSQRFNDGHLQDTRLTLSTIHVRRGPGPRESRLVHAVDGAPTHGDRLSGPYTLDGGFDAVLRVLLPESAPCIDLRLAPSPDPAQIRLTLTPHSPLPSTCPASAAGRTGELTLDRASTQVLSIQQTLPHPPGGGDTWSPLTWTVTFAPVTLDHQTFYTPATVQTRLSRRGSSEYLQSIAQYTGYGRLEVRSTIVPTQP